MTGIALAARRATLALAVSVAPFVLSGVQSQAHPVHHPVHHQVHHQVARHWRHWARSSSGSRIRGRGWGRRGSSHQAYQRPSYGPIEAIGSIIDNIRQAANAFSLNFGFMKAVAKVESDFNPRARTGSYIGLFQLSRHEFAKYGSGSITNAHDNALAAAHKMTTEAKLFESETHKEPTISDLYLIHQQGWQGAAEHINQPDRIAWQSMCATDEGREKGEKWCKLAIWLNTLPDIKHKKSVDNLTSGEFVDMWRQRIENLYARYSPTTSFGG